MFRAKTPRHFHYPNIRFAAIAIFAGLFLPISSAVAQSSDRKTVVAEPTGTPTQSAIAPSSPFFVFDQWLVRISIPVPVTVSAPATLQEFITPTPSAAPPFEVAPVILGQPELPLVGQAAAQAAQQWNSGFNYQGLTLSYVVLDATGKRREVRPVSKGLAPGERFRVRYTTSFEAIASIDQVVGDSPWSGQRIGQAWPRPGASVQSNSGEAVELPLDANAYFRFNGISNERYVLNIRHPKAAGSERSMQPAYRQDGARSSQYLQLVPANTYPAIEQVLAPQQSR